ncbi:unnamed protein product [Dicrocoelium dendriticum]|nr:unnamed protein product [Dicrocoelium dendriticum]
MAMESSVTCPICLGLLYKPILLPCSHVFCRECILSAVDLTASQCPLCRFRLSNWLRKIRDIDSVISHEREHQLRSLFPSYYKEKDLGKSPVLSKSDLASIKRITGGGNPRDGQLVSGGELHDDYLKEVEKYSRLRKMEEKKNEEASLALASQLLAEDELEASIYVPSGDPANRLAASAMDTLIDGSIKLSNSVRKCPIATYHRASRRQRTTLLDYAVLQSNRQNIENNEEPKKNDNQDEVFARELQSKYSSTFSQLVSVPQRKRRCRRSRR